MTPSTLNTRKKAACATSSIESTTIRVTSLRGSGDFSALSTTLCVLGLIAFSPYLDHAIGWAELLASKIVSGVADTQLLPGVREYPGDTAKVGPVPLVPQDRPPHLSLEPSGGGECQIRHGSPAHHSHIGARRVEVGDELVCLIRAVRNGDAIEVHPERPEHATPLSVDRAHG